MSLTMSAISSKNDTRLSFQYYRALKKLFSRAMAQDYAASLLPQLAAHATAFIFALQLLRYTDAAS